MAKLENIKNIIFDYGNVIFTLDFERSRQAWIDLGINDADTFYSHQVQNKIFTEFESGSLRAEEFRVYIRKILNRPQLTDEQIDHAWNSLLVGVPEGNHELLLNLKPKYRTFLLSNNNPIHYDHIMKYLKNDFGFDGNDHLFEKTAPAGIFLRLRRAQGFAAVVKGGLLGQNLRKDGHRVIVILAVQSRLSFFVLFSNRTRDLVQRFFCHE